MSDEAFIHNLKTLWWLPHREAADLPGFDQTLFDSAESMHETIERYLADSDARRRIAASMREAVVANDTYDALIDRVIAHLAHRFESAVQPAIVA